ncbi:MAG: methylated-DNA--[protein]-cysteine S-methyltransferase [Bacteroidales bacterium]|nr:methylated-DNA--[protein]-cysteine S-methyltransferase [Bacteroidales bacterium]
MEKPIEKQIIYRKTITTPLGDMIACTTKKGLCFLDFSNIKDFTILFHKMQDTLNGIITDSSINNEENQIMDSVEKELKEYFTGERKEFTIPLILIGTDFQKKVWQELLQIPYGKTISYLQEANNINQPKAFRAVANANGKNKISIIIPCHRVIANNGKLGGYGGGLDKKQYILNLESSN